MNPDRFLELLRKKENLESKKNTSDQLEEHSELISYMIILEKQIYYNNRFQYIDLVRKCINNDINCYRFQWDFFEIYQNDIKTLDKFINNIIRYGLDSEINFFIDSSVENFYSLIADRLLPLCDFLNYNISEKSFYHKLEQIYS